MSDSEITALQEDISEKTELLTTAIRRRQEQCPHDEVLEAPFEEGTFIDRDEFRVCTRCGAWESGFYNQFMDKLKPTQTVNDREEVLRIRNNLTKYATHQSKIARDKGIV